MTTIEISKTNPAGAPPARPRRSFNTAQRKLEIMGMQGEFLNIKGIDYKIYLFRGTPERLAAAQAGGYEFCSDEEIQLGGVGLANDELKNTNTDMGTRVSVIAGGETTSDRQALRLYVMKKRRDWVEEDAKGGEKQNDRIINALTAGQVGAEQEASGDGDQRYLDKKRTKLPEMFRKKSRR